MKKPAPVVLWAVIVCFERSEWIHSHTLRRLRKDAWEALCADWRPEHRYNLERERRKGKYRLARVVVTEKIG